MRESAFGLCRNWYGYFTIICASWCENVANSLKASEKWSQEMMWEQPLTDKCTWWAETKLGENLSQSLISTIPGIFPTSWCLLCSPNTLLACDNSAKLPMTSSHRSLGQNLILADIVGTCCCRIIKPFLLIQSNEVDLMVCILYKLFCQAYSISLSMKTVELPPQPAIPLLQSSNKNCPSDCHLDSFHRAAPVAHTRSLVTIAHNSQSFNIFA